ncbi:ThiF family adenylyltransferase [Leucobacter denitrificans]|uniref:ThiF family adenylyltransferase n=1 Tax=Leucobacter denitrificans TaxID=683042 RepID=A0A7G9S429_9MICO|nr:ThiF family adenylyltransferase [Leucobacter denitrificans]QNN62604.1 ThiF family adenylyltransferase [Leucobacter denitrificans]
MRSREADSPRPAPLVGPGPQLTRDQQERASRQMLLPDFGDEAQRRLQAARVLIVGAGGLGSASVPYLAGAGVGTIGIIDNDVVELSNLHRQIGHQTADLGRRKTTSLRETALALNPGTNVIEHDLRLTSSNALEIFSKYDLVIDGSDNFPTRYLVNDAASLAGIPLVWGSILGHHGQVSVAWHAYGPGYRDLFPQPPDPGDVVTCASGGVLPGLCGTIGSLLVTEAMKLITGSGEPLIGRVLVYDAMRASTREIRYGRDELAPKITELIDYELFCAGEQAPRSITATELIARLESGRPTLLDVRNADEREAARIVPSIAVPLPELEAGDLVESLEPGARVTVYCAKGPRSIRATNLLKEHGIDAEYLAGGIEQFAREAPQLIESGNESRLESA